jgi:hypothetical protein
MEQVSVLGFTVRGDTEWIIEFVIVQLCKRVNGS